MAISGTKTNGEMETRMIAMGSHWLVGETLSYEDIASRIMCPCGQWGFPGKPCPRALATQVSGCFGVAEGLGLLLAGKPHRPQGQMILVEMSL